MSKEEKALFVLCSLRRRYPVIPTLLYAKNPWEHLVATILSAQCTDARVNMITPYFFEMWPTPYDLYDVEQVEVESVIRSTGFFRNKAKHLIGSARRIIDYYGGEVPSTMEDLLSLPGVARKTANVVLWEQFGINKGLAIDTHVKRIMHHLGLTENTNPDKVEQDLIVLFPQEDWGDINKMMVWFGREVCDAKKPRCNGCCLFDVCEYSINKNIVRPA
ncbi:MAG: endonuclease III [Desulfovibrionaceae bacterium]